MLRVAASCLEYSLYPLSDSLSCQNSSLPPMKKTTNQLENTLVITYVLIGTTALISYCSLGHALLWNCLEPEKRR